MPGPRARQTAWLRYITISVTETRKGWRKAKTTDTGNVLIRKKFALFAAAGSARCHVSKSFRRGLARRWSLVCLFREARPQLVSQSHLAHLGPYMAALPTQLSKPETEGMTNTCPTLLITRDEQIL
jgi:hypothetical protein